MRPKLTTAGVLKALREFDETFRGAREWQGWENNKAHRYAILHDGKRYPVKKIASLASDVPVGEFSGGDDPGHANRLVEAIGLQVMPLRGSNADWVRDELILALNLYLKHRPNSPAKTSSGIRMLSRVLIRLGERLFPPTSRTDTFRNENSVYMKLMNFRRFDPQYTVGGKKGLSAGNKAEEEVWNEFASDPRRCEDVAKAIIATLNQSEDSATGANETFDDGFEEAPEGRLLTRMHISRERNRRLVEKKKQHVIQVTGKLECEACGFDFAARYGPRGEGYIECHHTKAVATLGDGARTHINDLAVICANCHRIIHRGKPWLTLAELKQLLRPVRPPILAEQDSQAVRT